MQKCLIDFGIFIEIIKYIDLYVGAVINIFLYVIVIKKIFNLKFVKNKNFILLYILLTSFFVFIINLFNKNVFKILLTIPFVTLGMKNVFYSNYKSSIVYVVIATIYMFISEIIVGFILSLLPFDYTFVFNNILGTTTGAIVVSIFTILILYIKKLSKVVNNFVDSIDICFDILRLIFSIAALHFSCIIKGCNNKSVFSEAAQPHITVIENCINYGYGSCKVFSVIIRISNNTLTEGTNMLHSVA